MAPTGLMDLPTELRLQILRDVFTPDGRYLRGRRFYLSGVRGLKRSCPALLVNRQIRREALTVMYGDPVWRVVNERFSWEICQGDALILLGLQHFGELTLVRRLRFEFDLDRDHQVRSLIDLTQRVNAAHSGMTYCCDLLAQARAPLDVEIAWVDRIPFRTWEATQAVLQPLSRLSMRTITITQYWKRPQDTAPSRRNMTRYLEYLEDLAPSCQQFAEYLNALTGVRVTWSLP